MGAASSAPPPHALRLRQLRKRTPPSPLPPSLLSAIHPLELACRDRFRKPVGVWKQLVSGAGGRLRAAESECPEEDKAENKGKPAPFPIFLFGLIFQKQFSGKSLFWSKCFLLFHLLQASIEGPNLNLGSQDQGSGPNASTNLLCNLNHLLILSGLSFLFYQISSGRDSSSPTLKVHASGIPSEEPGSWTRCLQSLFTALRC